MPPKARKNVKETIRTYFGTRAGSQSAEEENFLVDPEAEKNVAHNMADKISKQGKGTAAATSKESDSMTEIISLIKGLDDKASRLDKKVTDGFANLDEKMEKVTEKVEALEVEVDAIKRTQERDEQSIESLKSEVQELKLSLLSTQAYARKYHLLLYGVSGHETQSGETIARVRQFAKENLNMAETKADRITIRNAHRLQKRDDEKPATIVVVFLYWEEREAFLRAGPNLRGTRMSVRTDLPPELKQKRGKLASMAYDIRQEEKIQTRIREKGASIWIETRENSYSRWTRREM